MDDEPALCELLDLYFESLGMEVMTATTVEAGCMRIEQENYDLAILDWRLKEVPAGLDLLELSQARHPETPIIIFTGVEDTQELEQQLAGRAAAVMRKMASLNTLAEGVWKLLAAPAPNQTSPLNMQGDKGAIPLLSRPRTRARCD